jgi:5'-nucleotidase
MKSNTLMKAGIGAMLAFGLAAAPLALAPAQADPGSATADPTTTAALAPTGALPAAVTAQSHVVINEAYLNGGSAGASYKNKFVELYNPTNADVSLDGWSLQYRPGTGTAAPANVAPLAGTIKAGGYYLVNGGSNGANGRDLPATDYAATTINPAAGAGTVILSDQAAKLPADLPTGSLLGQPGIVDLLGYGTSNTFEGAAATAASVSTSLNRTGGADTDNNAADFTRDAATPTGTQGGDAPPPPPVDAGAMSIADVQGTGAASPVEGSLVTQCLIHI